MEDDAATYQITIGALPEHVLATLRNLEAYPEWQDQITAVEVLRSDDLGLPREAEITFRSMGINTVFKLALEHDERTMRWSLLEGDLFTRNDAEYTVTERDGGQTELALRQEMSLKWRMPQSMVRPMIERGVAATMEMIKRRAEQTAP